MAQSKPSSPSFSTTTGATTESGKRRNLEFKVCGQKVAVKATETDPDTLDQVVELVSAKIKEAERRGKDLAPHYTMLLALLDLAQDYVASKKRTGEFKQSINDKIARLTTLIEAPGSAQSTTRHAR